MFEWYRARKILLLSTASCLVLGACSIAPRPFVEQQIVDRATDNLERVSAKQEPVSGPISLYEAI